MEQRPPHRHVHNAQTTREVFLSQVVRDWRRQYQSQCESTLIASRFKIVQGRWAWIEWHARGPGCTGIIASAVPAALSGNHHIAWIADEIGFAFELHADMTFHNEPKFGHSNMEM